MKLLVTGSAGFIGYHLVKQLLHRNQDIDIIGIDNLNDYYEVNLKKNRLAALEDEQHFEFLKKDISDKEALFSLFAKEKFDVVINLAAQAGGSLFFRKSSSVH
ncbi:nucleoside-diphosphate-sugar epimerase [Enterococcus xiangfangensis]|nr:nucleoside-diphosphate-sugar epimerase [Enterococcus xiangfangensis]